MNLLQAIKCQKTRLACILPQATLLRCWQQVWVALVILLVAVTAFGQENRTNTENKDLGSIHGILTTTQDHSSGVAGISVKLTLLPNTAIL